MAQLVKNPPAMRETWVRSLGWENSLEEGKATHTPVFCPGEFHERRSLAGYSPWGRKEVDSQLFRKERLSLSTVTRKKPQEHAREEALLWRKQEGPKVETKLKCHPKGTGGSPTGQHTVCEEAEAGWE